jgi:NADP-dependent 3-hydroxy acid dehydrogenase YdfG
MMARRATVPSRPADRVALITGASSGIGEALARRLRDDGYHLTLVARRGERLIRLAQELGGPERVLPLVCDVRDRQAVAATARVGLDHWGRLDLLVLNAGVGGMSDFGRFDVAVAARVIETNLMGALYWLAPCLPELERAAGTVVGISSLAAGFGSPRSPAYCASKAALSTFLEGMRVACRDRAIHVLTVEPGWVYTEMTAPFGRLPLALDADAAARRIVRAIHGHRAILRFPWPAALIVGLMRRAPASLRERVLRLRDPRQGPPKSG